MAGKIFYVIVFFSNPERDRVYFYTDGDSHKNSMRSDKFITYLKNYMDPESVNSIIGTLGEHGTYWYFERQSKVLKRLSAATKKNDLTKIGSELLKQKANIERQIAGSSDNFQHRPLPNSEGFEPENIKPPGT